MTKDLGGLHVEICRTFATARALKDGYDVSYVGGRPETVCRTGIERLAHGGAVPATALAAVTELFRDRGRPPPRRPAMSSAGTSTRPRS
jgi:hypothetical protein